MLLIVTNRSDHTADWLIVELHRRGAAFVRFNTEDYPLGIGLLWTAAGEAMLRLGNRALELTTINAVWYRRPVAPVFPDDLDPGVAGWAEGQAREALDGLWRTLDARWVNDPDNQRRAASKPLQLRTARALGFTVPDSLVTNEPDAVREFVANHSEGVVCKPLRSGRLTVADEERFFFTSTLTAERLAQLDALSAEPYLFQALVRKAADLRVTVIGDNAIAVRIHSQENEDAALDWRRAEPHQLRQEEADLPVEVSERCVRLVRDTGCLFGAIDLAETPEGDYVFFENNPSGQWAWLEQRTGVPLRSCLADLLLAID